MAYTPQANETAAAILAAALLQIQSADTVAGGPDPVSEKEAVRLYRSVLAELQSTDG